MWLVKIVGLMVYIELIDVEIGVGVESGDGAKFCQDYYCCCSFANKL
jgi:hypothetical protein